TWGGDANVRTAFSISGGTGHVTNTGSTTYSAVLGPVVGDSEVYETGSISSFASSNFGDVLRWTDGNNWYKAYTDGATLYIQKKVAGTATMLATKPFAATAGVSYTIHFRAVGSTLTANIWPSSGTEPGTRMLTARPAGGSPGIGPVSVSPSPDGKDHRQQVVLDDRVLIVSGATVRTAVGAGSSLVAVDVTIQSRGPKAIANNADSFEIMGAEG